MTKYGVVNKCVINIPKKINPQNANNTEKMKKKYQFNQNIPQKVTKKIHNSPKKYINHIKNKMC